LDAEVREAERLADRGLVRLASLRLLERNRRLRGPAVLEVALSLLEEVIGLVIAHRSSLRTHRGVSPTVANANPRTRTGSRLEVGKVLADHVGRVCEVTRVRDEDAANLEARGERAAEGVGQLVRRTRKVLQKRGELAADAPQRNARQLVGVRHGAGDARVD